MVSIPPVVVGASSQQPQLQQPQLPEEQHTAAYCTAHAPALNASPTAHAWCAPQSMAAGATAAPTVALQPASQQDAVRGHVEAMQDAIMWQRNVMLASRLEGKLLRAENKSEQRIAFCLYVPAPVVDEALIGTPMVRARSTGRESSRARAIDTSRSRNTTAVAHGSLAAAIVPTPYASAPSMLVTPNDSLLGRLGVRLTAADGQSARASLPQAGQAAVVTLSVSARVAAAEETHAAHERNDDSQRHADGVASSSPGLSAAAASALQTPDPSRSFVTGTPREDAAHDAATCPAATAGAAALQRAAACVQLESASNASGHVVAHRSNSSAAVGCCSTHSRNPSPTEVFEECVQSAHSQAASSQGTRPDETVRRTSCRSLASTPAVTTDAKTPPQHAASSVHVDDAHCGALACMDCHANPDSNCSCRSSSSSSSNSGNIGLRPPAHAGPLPPLRLPKPRHHARSSHVSVESEAGSLAATTPMTTLAPAMALTSAGAARAAVSSAAFSAAGTSPRHSLRIAAAHTAALMRRKLNARGLSAGGAAESEPRGAEDAAPSSGSATPATTPDDSQGATHLQAALGVFGEGTGGASPDFTRDAGSLYSTAASYSGMDAALPHGASVLHPRYSSEHEVQMLIMPAASPHNHFVMTPCSTQTSFLSSESIGVGRPLH
ncbi:MAG: hypothetical protein EOO41_02015, partial [Methanobacteriota archaeon]